MTGSTIIQGGPPEEILPYTPGQTGALRPEIAALNNGGYAMVWSDDVADFGSGDTIFLSIADANGNLIGSPITVSGGGTSFDELRVDPSIDVLSNGNIVVAWSDTGLTDSGINYRIFDPTGTPVTGVLTANVTAGTAGDDLYWTPHVEALSGGGFVLSWGQGIENGANADNALIGRFFDASGTATSGEITLASLTTSALLKRNFDKPQVLELAGGNLVWAWKEGANGAELEMAITDGSGTIITPTFDPRGTVAGVGDFSIQPIAGGNYTVVMSYFAIGPGGEQTTTIVNRNFDPTGTALTGDNTIVALPFERRFPMHVTQDGSGGLLIAYGEDYTNSNGIVEERNAMLVQADTNGNVLGERFWLETIETGGSPRPETAITLLSDGSIAYVTTADFKGIYHGKLYNGDDPRFTDGSETITLAPGAETVAGLDGDDTITGGAGDDRISGGFGEDSLSGEGGDDIIQGRSGDDVIAGGAGNDTLRGDRGTDDIDGGDDDDFIAGGAENDELDGGAGNDTILGEGGSDTINGGADDDMIFGFRSMDTFANHGPFDANRDEGATNTLNGDGGNDVIRGGDGVDIISGGTGNDTLFGNGGNDTIEGGTGRDFLAGVGGDDLLILRDGEALFGPETFSGSTGTDTMLITGGSGFVGHGLFNHSIDGIEIFQYGAIGPGGDRTLIFDSAQFRPGRIDDLQQIIGLDVAGSTEVFRVFSNNNQLGDPGIDLSGVVFTDWGGQGERVEYQGNFRDETIIGSTEFDHLLGDTGTDTLEGRGSGDFLDGGDGIDSLDGGAGNDTLIGGMGADSINGGAGNDDTADYSGSSARVTVFLNGLAGISGDAQGDTLTNVENLIGSNANDFLGGSAGSNSLSGGDSQDILDGQDGGVSDTLNGGDGIDTAYYFGAIGNQVLDMSDHTNLANNQGEHTNDTWISIEGFFGANGFTNDLTGDNVANYLLGGSLGDTISGLDGADHLYGRGGNDTLIGGNGNDVLLAGAGTDTVTGGADLDIFYILTGNEIDIVTDWSETDDFFFFFQITGVGSYSDLTFADIGTDVRITSANNTSFEIIVQNRELTDLDDQTHFVFG